MPYNCWVPGCNSNGILTTKTSNFSFPKDDALKKLWLKAIPENGPPSKFSKICSRHFKAEDILTQSSYLDPRRQIVISVPLKVCRLRPGAVPCIFENLNSETPKNKFQGKESILQDSEVLKSEFGHTDRKKFSSKMRKCCVQGCRSNYVKPYVTVFTFPKDPNARQAWLSKIGRPEIKISENVGVCIKHFESRFIVGKDDIVKHGFKRFSVTRKKIKVKAGAVPTLFAPEELNRPWTASTISQHDESEEIASSMQNKGNKSASLSISPKMTKNIDTKASGINRAIRQKFVKPSTSTTNRPIITVIKAEDMITDEHSSDRANMIVTEQATENFESISNSDDQLSNQAAVNISTNEEDRSVSREIPKAVKRSPSTGSSSSVGSNDTSKLTILQSKRRKFEKPPPTVIGRQNDVYCWVCHRENVALYCIACPRAFHNRCAGELCEAEDWMCPECKKSLEAEMVDTRSSTLSEISLDKLSALLKLCLNKLKYRAPSAFHQPVPLEYYSSYPDYIIHPMDLSLIEKNVKQKLYGSTDAFLADVKWMYHNSCVFNGTQHPLSSNAKSLVKSCEFDMQEIEVCPDCFIHSCMQGKYWFSEVCRKPHPLVWAKLKGFPYWPAKVVRIVDGNIDARFFGAHDRAWVPVSQCYHLSKEMPTTSKPKKKGNYETALEELNVHVQLLIQRFGSFEYAPYRTNFNPDNKFLLYHGIDINVVKDDIPLDSSLSANSELKAPVQDFINFSESDVANKEPIPNLEKSVVSNSELPKMDSEEQETTPDVAENVVKPPLGIFEASDENACDTDAKKDVTELSSNVPTPMEVESGLNKDAGTTKKLDFYLEMIKSCVATSSNAIEKENNEENKTEEAVEKKAEESTKNESIPDTPASPEILSEDFSEQVEINNQEAVNKKDMFTLKLHETIESCKAKLGISEIAEDNDSSGDESVEEDEEEDGDEDEEEEENRSSHESEESSDSSEEDDSDSEACTESEGESCAEDKKNEGESNLETNRKSEDEIVACEDVVSQNEEKRREDDPKQNEMQNSSSEIVDLEDDNTNKGKENQNVSKASNDLEIENISTDDEKLDNSVSEIVDLENENFLVEGINKNKNSINECVDLEHESIPAEKEVTLQNSTNKVDLGKRNPMTDAQSQRNNPVTIENKAPENNVEKLQTHEQMSPSSPDDVIAEKDDEAQESDTSEDEMSIRQEKKSKMKKSQKEATNNAKGEEVDDDIFICEMSPKKVPTPPLITLEDDSQDDDGGGDKKMDTSADSSVSNRNVSTHPNFSLTSTQTREKLKRPLSIEEHSEEKTSRGPCFAKRTISSAKRMFIHPVNKNQSNKQNSSNVLKATALDNLKHEATEPADTKDVPEMKIKKFEEKISALSKTLHFERWRRSQEKNEFERQMCLVLEEMRKSIDAQNKRNLELLSRKIEQEKQRYTDEIKRKQWCAFCRSEARYLCCWNANYCTSLCQRKHFNLHKKVCLRPFSDAIAKPHFPETQARTSTPGTSEHPEVKVKDKRVFFLNMRPTPDVSTFASEITSLSSIPSVVTTAPQIQVVSRETAQQLVTTLALPIVSSTQVSNNPTNDVASTSGEGSKSPTMNDENAEPINDGNRRGDPSSDDLKGDAASLKNGSEETETGDEEVYIPFTAVSGMKCFEDNSDEEVIDSHPNEQSGDFEQEGLEEDIIASDGDESEDTESVSIGHGVEVPAKLLNKCIIFGITAKKLTRCLVDALFPDIRMLANSSTFGLRSNVTKKTRAALQRDKVDAIIDYVMLRYPDATRTEIVMSINMKCKEARTLLEKFEGTDDDKYKRRLMRRLGANAKSLSGVVTGTISDKKKASKSPKESPSTEVVSNQAETQEAATTVSEVSVSPSPVSPVIKLSASHSTGVAPPNVVCVKAPTSTSSATKVITVPKFLPPQFIIKQKPSETTLVSSSLAMTTTRTSPIKTTLLPPPQRIAVSSDGKFVMPMQVIGSPTQPQQTSGISPRPLIILGTPVSSPPVAQVRLPFPGNTIPKVKPATQFTVVKDLPK